MSIAGPCNSTGGRRHEKALRYFKVVMQLIIELLDKLMTHRHERRGGVYHHHEEQHQGVPAREPLANRWSGPQRHGSPSLNANPTPRTVWMSRAPPSMSTFLRRRAI